MELSENPHKEFLESTLHADIDLSLKVHNIVYPPIYRQLPILSILNVLTEFLMDFIYIF